MRISRHPSVNRVRGTGYLCAFHHNTLAGLNLHSNLPEEFQTAEGVSNFYLPFPLKSSLPIPLLPPSNISIPVTSGIDITRKFLKVKHQWKKRKSMLTAKCRTVYSANETYKTLIDNIPFNSETLPSGKSCGILPLCVSKLAVHYENDPDPHFKGSYNWYYNNCLSVQESGEDIILVSPAGINLDELHLKIVKPDNNFETETYVFTDQMIKEEPIFEVTKFVKKKFFCVRQKNQCAFVKYSKTASSLDTLLCINSKVPFVSMDSSKFSKNEISLMKVNKKFQIWDIKTSTKEPISIGQLPCNEYFPNNWCNLRYGSNYSELLAADRYNVYLYDTRTDLTKPANKWRPWNHCEICEEISLLYNSKMNSNYCYVGTSHQMFSLDLRSQFCQRWTHMMDSPPYIASGVNVDQKEYVFLGNQFISNVECIINDWSHADNPISRYSPKLLSSSIDTFHEAKLSKLCLDPIMSCRFNQSNIGLGVTTSANGETTLFTKKATGDIFYQFLTQCNDEFHEEQSFAQSDVKKLKKFEKKCHKKFLKQDKVLNVTADTFNMSSYFKWIMTKNEHMNQKKEPVKMYNPQWGMEKSYLTSCKDILAPKLLSVWDIEDEPEWFFEPSQDKDHVASVSNKSPENSGASKTNQNVISPSQFEIESWCEKLSVAEELKDDQNTNSCEQNASKLKSPSPDIFACPITLPHQTKNITSSIPSSSASDFEDNRTPHKNVRRSKKSKKKKKSESPESSNEENIPTPVRPILNLSQESPSLKQSKKSISSNSDHNESFSLLKNVSDLKIMNSRSKKTSLSKRVKLEESDSLNFFNDDVINFNDLVPTATSTQGVFADSPAMAALGFSKHSSFIASGKPPTFSISPKKEKLSPNKTVMEDECDTELNSTYIIETPSVSSQSIISRKRPRSSQVKDYGKTANLSQSSAPGF